MYVPELYEDEIIYSFMSRMISYNLLSTQKIISEEMFNGKFYRIKLHDQKNLQYFFDAMPNYFKEQYKIDDLIDKTYFKYAKSFLTKEKLDIVYEGIRYRKNHISSLVKLFEHKAFQEDKKFIKLCKECVTEDIETHGELYLRLEHQFPGNKICSKHNLLLNKISISETQLQYAFIFLDYNFRNLNSYKAPKKIIKINNRLLYWLENINKEYPNLNYEELIKKINVRLIKKNYKFKHIYPKFKNDFIEAYDIDILKFYDIDLDSQNNSWVKNLYNERTQAISIYKYLFLVNFLFKDFNDLLNENEVYYLDWKKFYCINPFCEDFNTDCAEVVYITKTDIKKRSVYIICHKCGFKYAKSVKSSVNKKNDYKHIINSGTIFKEKLIKLHEEQGYTFIELSELTGFTRMYLNNEYLKAKRGCMESVSKEV